MPKKGAFTLFEILGVFALMALVLSLGVMNYSVFEARGARPPDKQLKSIVKRARLEAFERGSETALYYDAAGGIFSIRRYESGEEIFSASIFGDAKNDEKTKGLIPPEIEFAPVFAEPVNAFSSSFDAIETLPCLRFYPDGSSSSAMITIKGSGWAEHYYLHPFNSVPVRREADNAL